MMSKTNAALSINLVKQQPRKLRSSTIVVLLTLAIPLNKKSVCMVGLFSWNIALANIRLNHF